MAGRAASLRVRALPSGGSTEYNLVSKLQVAILARSSQEMYQTVRIDWKHILSQVRASEFLYTRKPPKTIANTASHTRLFIWMKQWPAIYRQWNRRKGAGGYFVMVGRTDPSNSDNLNGDGGGWVSACVRLCARARACVCVRACTHACVVCLQYTIQGSVLIFDSDW